MSNFTGWLASVVMVTLSFGMAFGGESITVQGKVEAINLDERTIVISVPGSDEKTTLELTRRTRIKRGQENIGPNAIQPGDQVRISYDSELLVVSTIELATAGPTEALNLEELNGPGLDLAPWVSPDGLEIFWQAPGDDLQSPVMFIYTARRKNPDAFFVGKTRLFSGRGPVLSSDGLEMFFQAAEGETIYSTTRRDRNEQFERPRPVPSLSFPGLAAAPRWLSTDGLTLYLDLKNNADGGRFHTWAVSRKTRNAAWGRPSLVRAEFEGKPAGFRFTQVSVSEDGLHLYCSADVPQQGLRVGILSRSKPNEPFSQWREIPLVGPAGQYPLCMKPQFVSKTGELFLTSNGFFADPKTGERRKFDLWVIKDFEPPIGPANK